MILDIGTNNAERNASPEPNSQESLPSPLPLNRPPPPRSREEIISLDSSIEEVAEQHGDHWDQEEGSDETNDIDWDMNGI